RVALYSWSVTSSSEPAVSGTERSTELIAAVTLRTKARPAAGAFRSCASALRAAANSTGASRLKKRPGSRSRSSRSARCAASRGGEHARHGLWLGRLTAVSGVAWCAGRGRGGGGGRRLLPADHGRRFLEGGARPFARALGRHHRHSVLLLDREGVLLGKRLG